MILILALMQAAADPASVTPNAPNIGRYIFCASSKAKGFIGSGENAEAISSAAELACADLLIPAVEEMTNRFIPGSRTDEWRRLNAQQQQDSRSHFRLIATDEIKRLGRQASTMVVVDLRAKGKP